MSASSPWPPPSPSSPAPERAVPAPGGAATARVHLLGRSGCHLCDVARDVVLRVCREVGAAVEEIDVDTDAELRARYSDLVPVVLVDGVEHAHWHVDAERLRAALA